MLGAKTNAFPRSTRSRKAAASRWAERQKGPCDPRQASKAAFTIVLDDFTFTIQRGQVGVDRKEKVAIGRFKHSDERDPDSHQRNRDAESVRDGLDGHF